MPSIATMTGLLGEIYIKLENIHASAVYLWDSLEHNPFKITAFTKICDIAPDVADLETASVSLDVFKDFNINDTNLRRSSDLYCPALPSMDSLKGITIKQSNHDPLQEAPTIVPIHSANVPTSNSVISTNEQNPFIAHQNSFLMHSTNISMIDPSTTDQPNSSSMPASKIPSKLQPYMPALRSHNNNNITLRQLRSIVQMSNQLEPPDIDFDEPDRGDIEIQKDQEIDRVKEDIEEMKKKEAFKNKHGLHKKPPAETTHELTVELSQSNVSVLIDDDYFYSKDEDTSPPRLVDSNQENQPIKKNQDDNASVQNIKARLRKRPSSDSIEIQTPVAKKQATISAVTSMETAAARQKNAIIKCFLPLLSDSSTLLSPPKLNDSSILEPLTKETESVIIDSMNKVVQVLKILASAYMHQTSYHCREAAMELQKLDDNQYDTAWVLCVLGQAYYDAADYPIARIFFHRAFTIAPWCCQGVPAYSTCLWYLDYEDELNLLAYKMNDNYTHQYEAYIAAGNWTKCSRRSNETVKWFQKAVALDPRRYYGHTLLGYEEWEKGNHLGAKQHFAQAMMANKRAYLGWYGAGLAYKDMHEFAQAKSLLTEALRLHPRHPTLLDTMNTVEKALIESSQSTC
ncbi:unnamed protein product [Cunninghamella echinulata]